MTVLHARLDLPRGEDFHLRLECNLQVNSVTGVYGPSGSGKTTLLGCLAGLLRGDGDSAISLGGDIWQAGESWLPPHRRPVAYVFQDARLFPHLTVSGNLDFAEQRRIGERGPGREALCHWLQLDQLLTRRPDQLSRGQQQRVAIARALLSAPEFLLLDEPLANVDRRSRREILKQLAKLHRELDIGMIYVSHDMEELAEIADGLLVMEEGQLVAEGPLLELSSRMELALAHEEQAAAIVGATVAAQDREFGLTELDLEGQRIHVTATEQPEGTSMRLRIPARDVSLALERPRQTSILNILKASIDAIESGSSSRVLVRLKLGDQHLLARLTRKSISRLGLEPGQTVFVQVKSVALLRDQRPYD